MYLNYIMKKSPTLWLAAWLTMAPAVHASDSVSGNYGLKDAYKEAQVFNKNKKPEFTYSESQGISEFYSELLSLFDPSGTQTLEEDKPVKEVKYIARGFKWIGVTISSEPGISKEEEEQEEQELEAAKYKVMMAIEASYLQATRLKNTKAAQFWLNQAINSSYSGGYKLFNLFLTYKASLKESNTAHNLQTVLNCLYPNPDELKQYLWQIADNFLVSSPNFEDHIDLIDFFNTVRFFSLPIDEKPNNTLYNPEICEEYLNYIIDLLSDKNGYFVYASLFSKEESDTYPQASPFGSEKGNFDPYPPILRHLAIIGLPWQKFLYAERYAKRSYAMPYVPQVTQEEKQECEKFDRRNIDQKKMSEIGSFLSTNIQEQADFIGRQHLPNYHRNPYPNTCIAKLVLSYHNLAPLYDDIENQKEGAELAFWQAVKEAIERRRLAIIEIDDEKGYWDDERNAWYKQAVDQIIEEDDPEALNYYRALKSGHGFINLAAPFDPITTHLSLNKQGRYKAPYFKKLKEHLLTKGLLPYFVAYEPAVMIARELTSVQRALLTNLLHDEEKSYFRVNDSAKHLEEKFYIYGCIIDKKGYKACEEEFHIDGGLLSAEGPIFIKTKKFFFNGKIDAPKGAVIVAEDFEFTDKAKISNPGNCHFIQVPKVKLDDSLDICDDI